MSEPTASVTITETGPCLSSKADERATRVRANDSLPAAALAYLGSAVGSLVVATAFAGGRNGADWAAPGLWLGLVVIVASCAWVVTRPAATRGTVLGSLLAAGTSLAAISVWFSPLRLSAYDELLHARTLADILDQGTLFGANPLLPISPFYPGLEAGTAAVQVLTGLPPFVAALVVLLLCRVLFITALFAVAEAVADRRDVAGLVCLIYFASPHFVGFNSQFSYQTLAWPLALSALYLVLRPGRRPAPWPEVVLSAGVFAAVVVSHHLTAFAAVGLLTVLVTTNLVVGGPDRTAHLRHQLRALGVWVVLLLTWTVAVAPRGLYYLVEIGRAGVGDLSGVLAGRAAARTPFADGAGEVAPLWMQLVTVASLLALTALVVRAIWFVLAHPKTASATGERRAVVPWAIVALAFPLLPLGRVAPTLGEVADRASTFVYLGVAVVVGVYLHGKRDRRRPRRPIIGRAVLVGAVVLLFSGGYLLGAGPPSLHTPGDYLVSGVTRSADSYNRAAARWAGDAVPDGSRVISDRVGRLLLSVEGLHPVSHTADRIDVSPLYFSEWLDIGARRVVARADARFVVVDQRLATGPPVEGVYFEPGEWRPPGQPLLTRTQLDKFDRAERFARVYDNGAVVIYEDLGS